MSASIHRRKCRAIAMMAFLSFFSPFASAVFSDPAAAQDLLADHREFVASQPRSFDNTILFSRRGGQVVRSPRYTQDSAMPGDFDGDDDIDAHDFNAAQICHSFSGPGYTVPPACYVFDFDGDLDVDFADMAAFMNAYTGTLSGVIVEAGQLVPILASLEGYYSGAPGTNGNNALSGVARQSGYSQDDLWYEWKLDSRPADSGAVFIANASLRATAYTILAPTPVGTYQFTLKVTNLATHEFGEDSNALQVRECLTDIDCDDELFCNGTETCDLNNDECIGGAGPCDPLSERCDERTNECVHDSDGDSVYDNIDNCVNVYNPVQADEDGDGVGNACDNCPGVWNFSQVDLDADGVGNVCDNCIDVPNPDQTDPDGDGVGSACEGDRDEDGVPDKNDNCLTVSNPKQADADADGIGDACDNCPDVPNLSQDDLDGDGVGHACDNCPYTPNATQADADNDDLGNACDDCPNDADNDADDDGVCGDLDDCPDTAVGVAVDSDGCPICGNGVLNTGEQCDPPNGSICDSACQFIRPANNACANAVAVGNGNRSFSNERATTDGPAGTGECQGIGADVWYCYTATCDGIATVRNCNATYDSIVSIYNGCTCPPGTAIACNDDGCGTQGGGSSATIAALTGQSYLIRVGGFNSLTGSGTLTISCDAGCLNDTQCNDGLFCNGVETCVAGDCQPGTPVNCDDGVSCTSDSCNETADSCTHVPNHALCDNGEFCNGAEVCDLTNDCVPGTDPCDDGVECTLDGCIEAADSCDNAPIDLNCDDGLFCNGAETCDPVAGCQTGVVPCEDNVACTLDGCNEGADSCNNAPIDLNCDDGEFCNGTETCDPLLGCQSGSDPCPDGTCDEDNDRCIECLTFLDCDDGIDCTADFCIDSACDNIPDDTVCDNGILCDGFEVCDPAGDPPSGCVSGTDPCDDGVACTDDSCDERTLCSNVPNDANCPDDGDFCNGDETCDALLDCQSTGKLSVTVIPPAFPSSPPNEPSQSAGASVPAHLQVPIDTTLVANLAADEVGNAAAGPKVNKGPRLGIALYRDSSTGRDVPVKVNELLVSFRAGATAAEQNALLARYAAARLGKNTDGLEKLGYSLARVPGATAVERAIVNLRREALIDHVEPNSISRAFENIPAPRPRGEQWGLDAIRARLAWRVTRGDPSVVVAVIDTGVDLRHPDLVENLLPGYDFVSGTGLPQDDHGHGTQIAGIIAATGRMAEGILGVAPNCSILPLKALDAYGEGTIADVAEAIVYAADHGARIISLALGTYYRSEVLRAAVDYAYTRGCVVVAAAGNDGTSEPCYPASYSASVAVASIHPSLRASWFGNRGAYVDLSAPGEHIATTTLDSGHAFVDGTSAACGFVSGTAALIASADPARSNEAIRAALLASARDMMEDDWDPATGLGLIDSIAALLSDVTKMIDIGVVDLTIFPKQPMPGQDVNVTVTVRNHGTDVVGPFELMLHDDGDVVASHAIDSLASAHALEAGLTWHVSKSDDPQVHTLEAFVPAQPGELRIADNALARQSSVTLTPVCDVAVGGLATYGAPLYPGGPVTFRATIVNQGNLAVQDVPIQFILQDGTPVEPTRFVALAAGEMTNLDYEWVLPAHKPGPNALQPVYLLRVSAQELLGETRTDDNAFYKRLVFDRRSESIIPFHKIAPGKEVHQWIAKEGHDYFASQVEGADIAAYLGSISGSHGDNRNTFLEGLAAEDKDDRPPLSQECSVPLWPDCPYWRHFVAGADGNEIYDGLLAYDSALTQAQNIWQYAIDAYPGNKALAHYYLGHVAHLIGDMTVPAHTHNDEHPIGDSYEDTIGANNNHELWYYAGGRSGDWTQRLSLYADLYSLVYRTANYTEDYDSNDEDGDGPPYYYPPDYVDTWHQPQDVDNAGGDIDIDEITVIGDDLMPYAMKRTAELVRLFYKNVDGTAPSCTMIYPSSEDVGNPNVRNSMTPFALTATGSDSRSGIINWSYHFRYSYWMGSEWSDWFDVPPSPTGSSVTFSPPLDNTLYAFYVYVWNGAGLAGSSNVKYLLVCGSV